MWCDVDIKPGEVEPGTVVDGDGAEEGRKVFYAVWRVGNEKNVTDNAGDIG